MGIYILFFGILLVILYGTYLRYGKRIKEEEFDKKSVKLLFHPDIGRNAIYNALIQFIIHGDNISWSRFNNLLLSNSFIILAWVTLFCDHNKNLWILKILSILGFVVSLLWASLGSRGRYYVYRYNHLGKKLEKLKDDQCKCYLSGPLDLHEEIDKHFRLPERIATSRNLLICIPILFAFFFLILFYFSFA